MNSLRKLVDDWRNEAEGIMPRDHRFSNEFLESSEGGWAVARLFCSEILADEIPKWERLVEAANNIGQFATQEAWDELRAALSEVRHD